MPENGIDVTSSAAAGPEIAGVYALQPGFEVSVEEDRVVLSKGSLVLALDGAAGIILRLIDGRRSTARIRELLESGYPESAAQIGPQVARTFFQLIRHGALRLTAAAGDRRSGGFKLVAQVSTDFHLHHLPHFLEHYSHLGVGLFLFALHGSRIREAREICSAYPLEIVAVFGEEPWREVACKVWEATLNDIRRCYARAGEWCLFADVDELHEYPPDFFANLPPEVNVVRGR